MRWHKNINIFLLLTFAFLVVNGCADRQNGLNFDESKSKNILQDNGQGICLDTKSGKMWQQGRGGVFFLMQDAQQYAEGLNLGGYTDWRLPTKDELFDLHNKFFLNKNGNCSMKRGGEYWAADRKNMPALGPWETYHLCGPGFKYVESVGSKGYVRAIRQQ